MKKRVLIVDDDRTLTTMLSAFLQDQGYAITIACNGEAALAELERGVPDIILLDVQMPKMNGYTFLFEMKKIEQAQGVPVIVLTCKGEMEDIFKVEGVKEYIVKPFPNKELVEKIRKYV